MLSEYKFNKGTSSSADGRNWKKQRILAICVVLLSAMFLFSTFSGSFSTQGNVSHTSKNQIQPSATSKPFHAKISNFIPSLPLSNNPIQLTSSPSYKVTIDVSGLNSGNSWQVFIYNNNSTFPPFFNEVFHTSLGIVYRNSTTSSSMIAYLPAGEYKLFAGPGTSFLKTLIFNVSSQTTVQVALPGYYSITVQESSLSAGTVWNALAINSTTESFDLVNSSSSSMVLYLSNNNYELLAGPISSYLFVQNITVSGSSSTYTITLPHFQKVTVDAKNVPPGESFTLEIINNSTTFIYINSTIGSSMILYIPFGAYTYTATLGGITSNNHISKGITVTSSTNIITIVFPLTYKVTFSENKLPAGTTWILTAYDNNYSQFYSNSSTGNSMMAYLPNGTYNYSVTAGSVHLTKEFNVTGAALSIAIPLPIVYNVTFIETGLPAGTSWVISTSNSNDTVYYYNTITASSITVLFPDGTYNATASVGGVHKLQEYKVTGSSRSLTFNFSKMYNVTFTEYYLPAGISWTLNAYNLNFSIDYYTQITGNSVTVLFPNGTFNATASVGSISITYEFNVTGVSQTLSFKFPSLYFVNFNESGLPLGTPWIVNFNGSIKEFTVNKISFIEANGINYPYTVGNVTGYAVNPSSGQLTVDGKNVSISVRYTATSSSNYGAAFTESGLPSGTAWYVNLSNSISSGAITGSSYTFSLANGTYSYIVSTSDKSYKPSSYSGSFTVSGASVSTSIAFSEVTYAAVFKETGLPSGTAWFVNLSGGAKSGAITSSSYNFLLPNGTYSYTVSTSDKAFGTSQNTGSFNINGAPASTAITFKSAFKVTFTESGLPSGTAWYVNLSNGNKSGAITGSSYSFALTNGTYSYNIATTDKIYHSSAGSITVNGKNISQAAAFSKYTYKITFTETGLPSGTHWSMTFNGATSSSNGTTITFNAVNGTYSYTVSNVSGYSAPSGSVTVNGANVPENITFTSPPAQGISPMELYAITGVIVAIIAIAGIVMFLRRK